MENVCKDQVEEIVEFQLSGEPVEGAINTSKGCAEKINIPAADHQFPCGGELIHCKHGPRKMLGLGKKDALMQISIKDGTKQAGHALVNKASEIGRQF